MTERTPKTQRFSQIRRRFSPLLLEIQAFRGRRKPQETADFRRKPQIFAGNRRFSQIGLRHLRCATFSSALKPENLIEIHFQQGHFKISPPPQNRVFELISETPVCS